MKVIKLGGSVFGSKQLLFCLNKIEQSNQKPVIIVCGGGGFADQVRTQQQQYGFDEHTAHRMAILAMQQSALMMHALQRNWPLVGSLSDVIRQTQQAVSIWLPDYQELDSHHVEAGWHVTSDSLAAWLARQVQATELLLVKSAQIDHQQSLSDLQKTGVLDAAFIDMISNAGFATNVIHYSEL